VHLQGSVDHLGADDSKVIELEGDLDTLAHWGLLKLVSLVADRT